MKVQKVLYFGLFVAICAVFCLRNPDVYADSKQPPFFVPSKVLQKMNQTEKLPPVESMTFEGRQMPVVQEMQQKITAEKQQKAQKEAQQKRLEAEKAAAAERQRQIEQKQAQKRQSEYNKEVKSAFKPRNSVQILESGYATRKTGANSAPKNSANNAISSINTQYSPPQQPIIKMHRSGAKKAQKNASEWTFDDIIADYKKDLSLISAGKPLKNQRLDDIMRDYSNAKHSI